MPRTRSVSNEEVLTVAVELVSQYGVDQLTFAELGKATGLSPSTLVQRFDSKHELLRTMTKHCLHSMVPTFVNAQSKHTSAIQAIITAFGSMASAVTNVQAFANGQIFFSLALTDPDINQLLRESMADVREKIQEILDLAIQKEEIINCNSANLALLLQTTYEGAITTWLVYQREGTEAWVKKLLTDALQPYIK